MFLIYTLVVIDFTLINDNFGRSISNIFLANKNDVAEYILQKTNIIPFDTIKLFLKAYKEGSLEKHVVLENIVGNFFAFIPFAFFVPTIFSHINSAFKFFVFISILVICIELLQLMFLTGSADIDDFILNVAGAMLGYAVLQIPILKRNFKKFLFGENNESKS